VINDARKERFILFFTCVCSEIHIGFDVHLLQLKGAPEPVWTPWSKEKPLTPAGNRNPVVQTAVRHHTERVTLVDLSFHSE
jgi:hypothetical protein